MLEEQLAPAPWHRAIRIALQQDGNGWRFLGIRALGVVKVDVVLRGLMKRGSGADSKAGQ